MHSRLALAPLILIAGMISVGSASSATSATPHFFLDGCATVVQGNGCLLYEEHATGLRFHDSTDEILNWSVGDPVEVFASYDPPAAASCNDVYEGTLYVIYTITACGAPIPTPTCAGDGSGAVCPCANHSALGSGEGCANSTGFGARLSTSGSSTVANDDLAFHLSGGVPNQTSMLFQGAALVSTPFKDGILCAGTPTERIEAVTLDAAGSGSSALSIVTAGSVVPGTTRYYQQWYRDPGGVSPCGTGSNLSSGILVDWN